MFIYEHSRNTCSKLDRDVQITFHQSDSFSDTATNDGKYHRKPPTPCLHVITSRWMITKCTHIVQEHKGISFKDVWSLASQEEFYSLSLTIVLIVLFPLSHSHQP